MSSEAVIDEPIFPVMAARFIARVIDRACELGAARQAILSGTLLRPRVLENRDTLIPSACVYQAAENAARQSGNPYLCAEVSNNYDWFSGLQLPPFARRHPSLGDLMIAWLKHTNRDQHSTRFQMTIEMETVIIRGSRLRPSTRPTGQPDAWDIAAWVKVFSERLDRHWDSRLVSARVSDPVAIPPTMLDPASVTRSDWQGTEIRFPSDWLLAETAMEQQPTQQATEVTGPEAEIESIFELFDYSEFPNFDRFASFFGYEAKTLQRRLAAMGTSFSDQVDRARRRQAESMLIQQDLQIQEVSDALGYRNPSAFDRAFRRWHAISPRKWRDHL